MAHFAEVNSYGLVLRVVVIDNNDVNANGGDQSAGAEEAVKKIVPFTTGNRWVQTSYNGKFRYRFAGTGYYYDEERDVFRSLNPEYPSWIYNEEIHDWIPPIPVPTHSAFNNSTWIWKEENLQWVPVIL